MAVVMLIVVLGLMLQGSSSSEPNKGCMKWFVQGNNSCCETCFPGHRLVKKCGPKVIDLCTPCEPGTFTLSLNKFSCEPCSQCAGAQVHRKNCTPMADTVCGCKEGLTCGDDRCSFCVLKCPKGHEPTGDASCKPCPDGMFNDGRQVKCKPWSTRCPKANQRIVTKGDAFTDIKCVKLSDPEMVVKPEVRESADVSWLLVILLIVSAVVMIFIVAVAATVARRKKKPQKPVIRPPTDDPQTLIAIECSFHEAEQEQGSSVESLDSKDSSEQLIS